MECPTRALLEIALTALKWPKYRCHISFHPYQGNLVCTDMAHMWVLFLNPIFWITFFSTIRAPFSSPIRKCHKSADVWMPFFRNPIKKFLSTVYLQITFLRVIKENYVNTDMAHTYTLFWWLIRQCPNGTEIVHVQILLSPVRQIC